MVAHRAHASVSLLKYPGEGGETQAYFRGDFAVKSEQKSPQVDESSNSRSSCHPKIMCVRIIGSLQCRSCLFSYPQAYASALLYRQLSFSLARAKNFQEVNKNAIKKLKSLREWCNDNLLETAVS